MSFEQLHNQKGCYSDLHCVTKGYHNGRSNNDRLSDFQSVDSCQDVDGVGAEHCQHAHVDVVQEAQINIRSKDWPEKNQDGNAELCEFVNYMG